MSIEEDERIEDMEFIGDEEVINERKSRTIQDIGFYIMFIGLILIILFLTIAVGYQLGLKCGSNDARGDPLGTFVAWMVGLMVYIVLMVGMFSGNLLSASVYIFFIVSIIFIILFLYFKFK